MQRTVNVIFKCIGALRCKAASQAVSKKNAKQEQGKDIYFGVNDLFKLPIFQETLKMTNSLIAYSFIILALVNSSEIPSKTEGCQMSQKLMADSSIVRVI